MVGALLWVFVFGCVTHHHYHHHYHCANKKGRRGPRFTKLPKKKRMGRKGPRAGDEYKRPPPGTPGESIDLGALVKEIGTARDPIQAFAKWKGRYVSTRGRVFNTEVNTKTKLRRLLLDPPGETRGVVARMNAGEKVVMLALTSYSKVTFLWFRRGAKVKVKGVLGSIDISNASWYIIFLNGYTARPSGVPIKPGAR